MPSSLAGGWSSSGSSSSPPSPPRFHHPAAAAALVPWGHKPLGRGRGRRDWWRWRRQDARGGAATWSQERWSTRPSEIFLQCCCRIIASDHCSGSAADVVTGDWLLWR